MNDLSSSGKDWTTMIPQDLPHREKIALTVEKIFKNRIFMIKMSIIFVKILSSMLLTIC